jgi:hypothetical protein
LIRRRRRRFKWANTIVQLIGNQATNPATGASSLLTTFDFFFANPTTLCVADEGDGRLEKFVTLQASLSGEVYLRFMAPLKRRMVRPRGASSADAGNC